MALTPTWLAPMAIQRAAISSSVCFTRTPYSLARAAIHSMIVVAGVIGYADTNRQPDANAPRLNA